MIVEYIGDTYKVSLQKGKRYVATEITKGIYAIKDETGEVYAFLGSGTYNLLFEKEGYESFLLEDVEIKKDDVLYKNILMRKASNVTGKVVDNEGNSLKDVNLTFKTSNSDSIAVKTDESGSFSKKIAYGTYTLIISKDGYETKQINVEVNDSQKDLGQNYFRKRRISQY